MTQIYSLLGIEEAYMWLLRSVTHYLYSQQSSQCKQCSVIKDKVELGERCDGIWKVKIFILRMHWILEAFNCKHKHKHNCDQSLAGVAQWALSPAQGMQETADQ